MNMNISAKTTQILEKTMFQKSLYLAAVLSGFLIQGCLQNDSVSSSKNNNEPATSDVEAKPNLVLAAQVNDNASTHRRLAAPKSAEGTSDESTTVPVTAVGWSSSQSPDGFGTPKGFELGAALLKRSSGLAKLSASGVIPVITKDTTWILLPDSANPNARQIRTYNFTDSTGSGTGRDSIVLKAPYVPANPTTLGHVSMRTFTSGKKTIATVYDEDGDGILNEGPAATGVKLRKVWITTSGDTTWKTITNTAHGQTTYYDSLGSGKPSKWTDSIYVAGKVIWWQKTFVLDGDGYIPTKATTTKTRVYQDSYRLISTGLFYYEYASFGTGLDGNYMTQADNERYAYRSTIVTAAGLDQRITHYGDGDGDGFFWTPATGAVNKVWVRNVYGASEGIVSSQDSLVETLPVSGKMADAKISYFAATLKYTDGTETVVNTKSLLGTFSGKDTIMVQEHKSYAGYVSKSASDPAKDLDSTLKVTWVLPGDLTTPADDKLVSWLSQSFYKSGHAEVSTVDVFTPDIAVTPGKKALAGTSIHQDVFKPVSSQSVIRTVKYRVFDPAKNLSDWKEIRLFENGDSSVTTGSNTASGVGSYATDLGENIKSSGWSDANTGAFKDTLKIMGTNKKPAFEAYTNGTLSSETGIGEFDRTTVRQGVSTQSHFKAVKDGSGGLTLTATTGLEEFILNIKGDSSSWTETKNGITRKLNGFAEGAGTYRVTGSEEVVKDGLVKSKGEYTFGEAGAGSGTYTHYTKGVAQPAKRADFRNDGVIFLGGVKISP
jgi:hypothetical protein